MKKIAIVCDWLTNLGGAERVVYQLHQMFPEAPIYTSLYNPDKLPQFKKADVRTSFLQKIPGLRRKHQLALPLLPYAFEQFDLSEYDLVISSSFAFSKGVLTDVGTKHVCYCHNPTRYLWDESHEYLRRYRMPRVFKWLMQLFSEKLRIWDRVAAERPDFYLANSEFVRQRIQKYYQRQAKVLYPGVELPEPLKLERQDYYLACGRITAQKYFDLVVEAFNELKLPLKIVGEGPLLEQMKELNCSDKTEFLGFVSDQELMELYAGAKALVFPQAEDFGIVPIEAQAQGCPVIFYAKGGALETCLATNEAGIGFAEQSLAALKEAVLQFEQRKKIDHLKIKEHVDQFSSQRFAASLKEILFSFWGN